jgi:corrinoid protein of di/trimethylamine methyltransferase
MGSDNGFDVTGALVELRDEEVLAWVRDQLDQQVSPHDVVEQLAAGLEIIGRKFASGEMFIPELVVGGEIFTQALDLLAPAIKATGTKVKHLGTVVLGTVEGDLHDLGQNLVAVTFVANGFKVVKLGTDVPPGNFVEAAKKHSPDLIGLSALLTTTMEAQREVIQAFASAELRDSVKIMVGGAVVNQDWADEIGADAYGSDAIDALNKAKVLLGINY